MQHLYVHSSLIHDGVWMKKNKLRLSSGVNFKESFDNDMKCLLTGDNVTVPIHLAFALQSDFLFKITVSGKLQNS